jgi:3-hydroxyisobutyrate dehydrogenase-like beta-hydroxyacid dehydrogenase
MTAHPRIGFIGLGFMGHGMAHNLLAKGFPMMVMAHRKREAVNDLAGKGAVEVTSAKELAGRSDVVILCVTGAEQVDDLLRRPDGIAAGAGDGLIVIDCTTSAPATLQTLARDYPAITFVDAPLGRAPKDAWAGALSVMVGARPETLEQIRPVLSAFVTTIQHAGPPGSGHTLKLINNILSLGYGALHAEALLIARKAGLSTQTYDELVGSSRMNCEFYQTFMGWARNGDATTHPFALSVADHTITDAAELARSLGLEAGVLEAVRSHYVRAVSDGFDEANLPELVRAVAHANGVTLLPATDE